MANIDEELKVAKDAKAAIENRSRELLEILRTALYMARTQQTTIFSSEAALTEARPYVGNALSTLIFAIEARRETPERINKAKAAIEDWIKELEAAKP